jgi:transcriptional regulator with XRE-family HTH domain
MVKKYKNGNKMIWGHKIFRQLGENNLLEFRLEAGLTVHELCNKAGVNATAYVNFVTGKCSPIYQISRRKGQIKDAVIAFADVLGVTPSELFPREICTIDPEEKQKRIDFLLSKHANCEINEALIGAFSMRHSQGCWEERVFSKNLYDRVKKIIDNKLPQIQKDIIYLRFFHDCTLRQIGSNMGACGEKVRQIEAKALRYLRTSFVLRKSG